MNEATMNEMTVDLFAMRGEQQAEWQRKIGFGGEGDALREAVADARLASEKEKAAVNLRNYYLAKMMLIVTEVAEAVEEVRNGHSMNETYYNPVQSMSIVTGEMNSRKPEGVLSELADVIIRIWSLTGEAGISKELGAMIVEKLHYNETRAHKHGGKAI